MSVTYSIDMDPTHKILLRRALNENGDCQRYFTEMVARLSDPYVPFLNGPLKNNKHIGIDYILHNSPYAAKQFYTNSGNGKQGTSHGGLRGSYWTPRMWANRGGEITRAVAARAGGRAVK